MVSNMNGLVERNAELLVFTATYNEIDNIESFLESVWAVVPNAEVLVVDDNSPDGTGQLLDKIADGDSRLTVVHRPAKLGLGTAHHLAMLFAIQRGFEVLVTMDADHSHDPRHIPQLLDTLSHADFVTGSRYMPGGSCDYAGYRRAVSVAANQSARMLLGLPLHEFTTSFRAFRVSKLAQVNFVKLHNNGYSFFMESVYRLHQAGLRLAEIPINFRDRYAGASKIPRWEILNGALKLLRLTGSRLLRRAMPPASPPTTDRCANCNSHFLSEVVPPQLENATVVDRSNAFRCSSMRHADKPRVVKCLQCGLCQVPLSEQPRDLEQLYADVVDQTYLDNVSAKRKTFARAYKRIQRFSDPPGRLLEVGSYCGLFLQEAQRHGWTAKGIEPSRWASNYASAQGLDVTHGSFEDNAPTLGGELDFIASWDVLEHVRDPKQFLTTACGLLKPQGILALSTIDIDTWFPRLMGRHWPWIMEMHLYYFGSGSLERMMSDAGFELLCVEPYSHYASLRYIFRKFAAACPRRIGTQLAKAELLVPNLILPVTLGDVRLYVGKKR